MNIHCFLHVPFEGPGQIAQWAQARGHVMTFTRWFESTQPPALSAHDFLVVMGGPMNVYEYRRHPWLRTEKILLEQAVARGVPILGICLGAQLLADVLGAKVYQNAEKEIGWFPVRWRPTGGTQRLLGASPTESLAFHWHGDTFDLPRQTEWLAESEACPHQAFGFGPRVVGLQFHLEVGEADIASMVAHGSSELVPGRFVQTAPELLQTPASLGTCHSQLWNLLDRLSE